MDSDEDMPGTRPQLDIPSSRPAPDPATAAAAVGCSNGDLLSTGFCHE